MYKVILRPEISFDMVYAVDFFGLSFVGIWFDVPQRYFNKIGRLFYYSGDKFYIDYGYLFFLPSLPLVLVLLWPIIVSHGCQSNFPKFD